MDAFLGNMWETTKKYTDMIQKNSEKITKEALQGLNPEKVQQFVSNTVRKGKDSISHTLQKAKEGHFDEIIKGGLAQVGGVAAAAHGMPSTITIQNKNLQVEKLLGEGGYSFVFLVSNVEDSNEKYALKRMIASDASSEKEIEKEIQFLQKFCIAPFPGTQKGPTQSKRNFVNFYGYSKVAKKSGKKEYFILLEFCENSVEDLLQKRLDESNSLSEFQVLSIFRQICFATTICHKSGVSHRDLKIENVLIREKLLSSNGKSLKLNFFKLCDFGSASTKNTCNMENKSEFANAEEEIERFTTPAYRAPEMVDLYSTTATLDYLKTDIWALGVILYKLMFFVTPFESVEQGGKVNNLQLTNGKFPIPSPLFKKHFMTSKSGPADYEREFDDNDEEIPKSRPQAAKISDFFSQSIISLLSWIMNPKPDQRPTSQEILNKICKIMLENPSFSEQIEKNSGAEKKDIEMNLNFFNNPANLSSPVPQEDQNNEKTSKFSQEPPAPVQKADNFLPTKEKIIVNQASSSAAKKAVPATTMKSPLAVKPAESATPDSLFSMLDWQENGPEVAAQQQQQQQIKSQPQTNPKQEGYGDIFADQDFGSQKPQQQQKKPQQTKPKQVGNFFDDDDDFGNFKSASQTNPPPTTTIPVPVVNNKLPSSSSTTTKTPTPQSPAPKKEIFQFEDDDWDSGFSSGDSKKQPQQSSSSNKDAFADLLF